MNFTFIDTPIQGLMVVEPKAYGDDRGFFMETYHRMAFAENGIACEFVQDNFSVSKRGVLRGLHFQQKHPQGKLVRVIDGQVYDVAVDLREGSATFGKWHAEFLSAENRRQLFIPEGFAHGFLVMSDTAAFSYKCTAFYDPSDQQGILWNDKELDIQWPITSGMELALSQKDMQNQSLQAYIAGVKKDSMP